MTNSNAPSGAETIPPMLSVEEASKPLRDIRIVDMSHHLGGAYGPMLLAKLGAEVIKVERPGVGDAVREVGAFRPGAKGPNRGGSFLPPNLGKKSITVNIKEERGREIIRALVRVSDVLCENYTTGALDKQGLGYAALREVNPRLVYASLSGYGRFGNEGSQYWGKPMLDIVAQGLSGVMENTGERGGPPVATGPSIGDMIPALFLMVGVLSALHAREQTGQGCYVDVSMVDAMMAMAAKSMMHYELTGEVPQRGHDVRMAPWGIFKGRDGYIVIACSVQNIWESFCRAMDRADLLEDPRLQTGPDRARHLDSVLLPAIEGWLAQRPVQESAAILSKGGVPAGTVQNPIDIYGWDLVERRHMLVPVEDPILGPIRMLGNPMKFNGISKDSPIAPPLLGEHTDEILRKLVGLSDDEIQRLRKDGVV